MRKALVLCLAIIITICSCKQKKAPKTDTESYFPALAFIKSQVAHVDTSVYPIYRVQFIDSAHTDTTYIRREDFRAAASDFLSLPDLEDPVFKNRYTVSNQYDETLGKVLITYTPINPDKEQIQLEEVLIKPEEPKATITNIIINTVVSTKDSVVEKKMLWRADESFQVTTSRQLTGQPETLSTYKVSWNESDSL